LYTKAFTMTSSPISTLIVVDPTVENYQSLIDNASPNAEVLVLDATRDGIEQITEALASHTGIESLQIVSHGGSGRLQLGAAQLSLDTIESYAAQLEGWSSALSEGADILLYGCDVAAGQSGSEFVNQLKDLIGADIAASTDLTGSAALGGDWDLETQLGTIETTFAFAQSALESYDSTLQVLVNETFAGADVTSGPWLFGRGGSASQFNPFLTARNNPNPSQGGLPGSPTGTPIDQPGQGTLRLTDADRQEATFVIYNNPIPSNAGLSVTFDIFSYGGTGADGISFFLIDGSQSPTVAGGFGGSFGYAQRNIDGTPGLVGGYLGIAFDEYGNFSNTETTSAGSQKPTGPGRIPDSISVRGSQETGYAYLTGTSTIPQGIDVPNAPNREAARRRVNVDLTQTGVLTVRIDLNQDNDFNDANEVAINAFDAIAANSPVPETFKFGFAGATGSQTNIHEIRNLQIETISEAPEVADVSATLDQGEVLQIPGLNATDSDGTIANYIIETLPPAEQGTLFLGDPAQGGTAITVGQEIAPAQIGQIFFQGAEEFFGNVSFTYNATDNTGSVDATPGTVRLTVNPVLVTPPGGPAIPPEGPPVEPGCEPGLNLRGTNGADRIEGSEDSDTIRGLRGNDVLLGLECGDTLEGNQGRDRLIGDGGNDTLRGNQGNDVLRGGQGIDFLFGNLGNDDLDGGTGDDAIDGGYGNDQILGKRGSDVILGNNGDDTIEGGAGNDNIDGGRGQDLIRGGGNRDVIRGRQGNDRIRGDRGNDRLFGNLGDDRIDAGRGGDRLNGGYGDDVLFARRGNDQLRGKEGNDTLYGNRGRDNLLGEAGDDLIVGGPGRDVLTGGVGADRFFFLGGSQRDTLRQSTGAARDRITDFSFAEGDKLLLSFENNVGVLSSPSALFNAGAVVGRNIIRAASRAYADKNQEATGRQRLQAGEAVFFEWRGQTFLSVNNDVSGYGFRDLTVDMSGIQFKAGDRNAGTLTVADYFAA
jgi:Ca2+-binding RTX toxin-like protein